MENHYGHSKEIENLITSVENQSEKRPILIISHQATLTGAPAVAAELGRYLSEIGIKIVFLVIQEGSEMSSFTQTAQTYTLNMFNNSAETAVQEIGIRHRPFAAVCNTITTTHYAELLKREIKDIVCHGWIHEMPTVINSFFGGAQTAASAYKHCDVLAFGSEYVRDRFAIEYNLTREELFILPYIRRPSILSDIGKTSPKEQLSLAGKSLSEDEMLLMGCGTAEPRKGLDTFVRVAHAIIQKLPQSKKNKVSFEWYGCPSYNENYVDFCKHDAKQLGIEESILFLQVSHAFIERLKSASAFLLTSREDPYPLVILDAMGCGIPFVCFENAGGAADLANLGAGIAIPYGDEYTFAEQVIRLLDDKSMQKNMGRVGIERILQVNNWKNVVNIFLEQLTSARQRINSLKSESACCAKDSMISQIKDSTDSNGEPNAN